MYKPIYETNKANFGAKVAFFRAKHPNYFGKEEKFWYPHIRKPLGLNYCTINTFF